MRKRWAGSARPVRRSWRDRAPHNDPCGDHSTAGASSRPTIRPGILLSTGGDAADALGTGEGSDARCSSPAGSCSKAPAPRRTCPNERRRLAGRHRASSFRPSCAACAFWRTFFTAVDGGRAANLRAQPYQLEHGWVVGLITVGMEESLSPVGRALPGPANVIDGHAVAGNAFGTGQGLRQPMPGALRGIEQNGMVESARHLLDQRPRAVGRPVVGPETERSPPLLFPPRGEIDNQVYPPFETQLRVDGIVEMNVELAAASVRMPAAAVQPGIGK